jgi:hypothetical protein
MIEILRVIEPRRRTHGCSGGWRNHHKTGEATHVLMIGQLTGKEYTELLQE